MTWFQIDVGRPIQGPEFEPERSPRDIIGVDVAVDAVAGLVRLKLTIGDDPTGQVVLDASNTFALWSALGVTMTHGRSARLEELRDRHASRTYTRELVACDSQCYKLPRQPDGVLRHHPECAVSRPGTDETRH